MKIPLRLFHGTATHTISLDRLTPLAMMLPWPRYLYRKPMVIGVGIPPNSMQAFPFSGADAQLPSSTFTVATCTQPATPLLHSALGSFPSHRHKQAAPSSVSCSPVPIGRKHEFVSQPNPCVCDT
jgi:hypothetical protein